MRFCRWVKGALCGFLVAGVPVQALDRHSPPLPNIILITVDTFRPDRLGYYGHNRDTSPNLDALSREGVFFTQAFTTSAWTTPGLISLHTSQYAPEHGIDIRGRSLAPEVETLADILRAGGYRAPDIFFLTDVPNFRNLGLEPYEGRRRFLKKGDEILFRWLEEEAARRGRGAGAVVAPADQSDSHRPFFLYYHYRDLHQPYNPGPEYEALYTPSSFGHALNPLARLKSLLAEEKMELVKREVLLPRGVIDFSSWDRDWIAALYDGQIRKLDEEFFARLRTTLKTTGLDENCLIVISADHGEELLDHGLVGHVSTFKEARLYDEIIRIPLIMWGPGMLPGGRVIDNQVQCIDVMPTLLELAGLDVPSSARGRSLLPLVEGDSSWQPRPVYCATSGGGYAANPQQYARRMRAVRTERWKLTHTIPEGDTALFDLQQDPLESEDVAASHPAVVDSLARLLSVWLQDCIPPPPVEAPGRVEAGEARSAAGGREVAAAIPEILEPTDGDTVSWRGAEQSIRLRWTGESAQSYTIQYSVGRGVYHLEGELTASGTEPQYGPFHEDFWNSLVLYNPWKFRVFASGRPDASSQWVTFHLASTGSPAGGMSAAAVFVTAAGGVSAALEELIKLSRGIGLAGVDLLIWMSGMSVADVSVWVLIAALVAAGCKPVIQEFGGQRCRLWGGALGYIAFVYATIPLLPTVWEVLLKHSEGAVRHLGIVAVAVPLVAVAINLWRRFKGGPILLPYVALLAIAVCYAYLLARFAEFPAERLHLVEYGLVAILLLRALRLDFTAKSAFALAFALTGVVGLVDEGIQAVLPQRYFEFKDILLNIVSGGLGLLVVGLAFPERADADD